MSELIISQGQTDDDDDDSSVYIANHLPDFADFESASESPRSFQLMIDGKEETEALKEDLQETVNTLHRLRRATMEDNPFTSFNMPDQYKMDCIDSLFGIAPPELQQNSSLTQLGRQIPLMTFTAPDVRLSQVDVAPSPTRNRRQGFTQFDEKEEDVDVHSLEDLRQMPQNMSQEEYDEFHTPKSFKRGPQPKFPGRIQRMDTGDSESSYGGDEIPVKALVDDFGGGQFTSEDSFKYNDEEGYSNRSPGVGKMLEKQATITVVNRERTKRVPFQLESRDTLQLVTKDNMKSESPELPPELPDMSAMDPPGLPNLSSMDPPPMRGSILSTIPKRASNTGPDPSTPDFVRVSSKDVDDAEIPETTPPPPPLSQLGDLGLPPSGTGSGTGSGINSLFEMRSNHFMSMVGEPVPFDSNAIPQKRGRWQLVPLQDFAPSNTFINPVLLLALEQVTYENQFLTTMARILENEETGLREEDIQRLSDDCIYLAKMEVSVGVSLECEKCIQDFNRTHKRGDNSPRDLDHALTHQKRTLGPGIRLFQPQTSVEVRYNNDSVLVSCDHLEDLKEQVRFRWGDEVTEQMIFGWTDQTRSGVLLNMNNPDAFSYFLSCHNRLPALVIVNPETLSDDELKIFLKLQTNYKLTNTIIQRGLRWEALHAQSLLFLTWPIKLEPDPPAVFHSYRFRATKQNNVHKNTFRFFDIDTESGIITITHPDRQNYNITIDINNLTSIQYGGKDNEIVLHCEASTHFDHPVNIAIRSRKSVEAPPVPPFRNNMSPHPPNTPTKPFRGLSAKNSGSKTPKTSIHKVYDLLFDSEEERNRFFRLTQMFVLKEDCESALYSAQPELMPIPYVPYSIDKKAELVKKAPINLMATMVHQVWVEYMTMDNWTKSRQGFDSYHLVHEQLQPYSKTGALHQKNCELILERFFGYVISIGFRIEEPAFDNQADLVQFAEIWTAQDPRKSLGDDPMGFYPFFCILAEHLHDLYCAIHMRQGFVAGADDSSRGELSFLRPYSEVCMTSPSYKYMRINQVVVIFKILRMIGFTIQMQQTYKTTEEKKDEFNEEEMREMMFRTY